MASPTHGSSVYKTQNGGTATWTVTQGAGNGLFGVMVRDSQWLDARGSWGGITVTDGITASALSGMSHSASLYHVLDLTGKSGDSRSAYSPYGDERSWVDMPLTGESGMSEVDTDRVYTPNVGSYTTQQITLNPGSQDCLALLLAISDHGASWSVNGITAPGITCTQQDFRYYPGIGYGRVYTAPVPADNGDTVFSCGMHPGDHIFMGMLIGNPAAAGKRKLPRVLIL